MRIGIAFLPSERRKDLSINQLPKRRESISPMREHLLISHRVSRTRSEYWRIFRKLHRPMGDWNVVVINETAIEKNKLAIAGAIKSMYRCLNPGEIEDFLEKQEFLLPYLIEAPAQIYRYFAGEVELCLELHRDPEEAWDELFIIIQHRLATEKIQERMECFHREWFLDILPAVKGKLCVTEEIIE